MSGYSKISIYKTPIEVNSVGQGLILSAQRVNVNLTDGTSNIAPVSTTLVGNTLTLEAPEIWWKRPSGWLPMPTITAADNKFAGLYAVFEDGFNAVAISIGNVGASSIDFGDGTTDSGSGSVTYNHVYDYATVTGSVLVSDDGRNYKQVMIEIDYEATHTTINISTFTTPTTGTNNRSQNWLDVSLATTYSGFAFIGRAFGGGYNPRYLQRIKMQGLINTIEVSGASTLKVFDYDFAQGLNLTISTRMQYLGDFRRDAFGTPINIDEAVLTTAFSNGLISEIGDLTTTNGFFSFGDCKNLQKVGNIDLTTSTTIAQMFTRNPNLKEIGTITASASLTDISNFGQSNFSIAEIIFTGDLSGVNNTTQAFLNNYSLRRLILPNITVGFDIRVSQITGTNLQDLFTSLGTAAGAQTITLSSFTIGEDTSTATSKGFTIAYA